MKNLSFLMIASFASLIFFSSCSTDNDCHECHLAYQITDSTGTIIGERAFDISNPNGGDEFCGDELTDVEDPSNTFTTTVTLYSDDGNDSLVAGTYGNGDGWEVHCEEHGDDH